MSNLDARVAELAEKYRPLAAEILAEQSNKALGREYFLAGLLMDIGRLALLKTIPDDYLPVLNKVEQQQLDLCETESEILGIDHVQVGAKLMVHWKLPEELAIASSRHAETSSRLLQHKESPEFELTKVTAVAGAVGDHFCGVNKGPALQRMQQLTSGLFGLSSKDLDELLERVGARVEEAGDLFTVNTDHLPKPGELMAQANEHLAQLAIRAQMESSQAVARQQEVEQEKNVLLSKNRQLQHQAFHDPLTRLYNRQFFGESLDKEISLCIRRETSIGVIFADIDRFKQLNDTYGHQFGDEVLAATAEVFRCSIRESDIAARYGGEEFVVLAHEPTEEGLAILAERIRAAVESEDFRFDDVRVPVTVSLGAAIAAPRQGESGLAERLLGTADEAMYQSKEDGRNQVHLRTLADNTVDQDHRSAMPVS